MNTVLTKTFILILAQKSPRSLLNGSNLTLSKVLKDYNKNEFHHIYPKAYVTGLEEPASYSVNCLANFCILSRADNKKIDCKKPSEYRKDLMPLDVHDICESNFINENELIKDDFESFIKNRSELLTNYVKNLIS
ncbi:hypothetical protein KWF06_15585 [Acinetobacter baumannii]